MDERDLKRIYSRSVAERGTPDAGGCPPPESILAVLQREGAEEARLATLEHVMSCAACHREYELLSAVNEAAVESGSGTSGRAPWWTGGRIMALAASLAAAIGAALVVRDRIDRADTIRGEHGDIALVSPAPGAAAPSGLRFVWRTVPGASGYVLEVQHADGAVAFADTTSDTTLILPDPSPLQPEARYRWWVRELTDGSEPRSSELRPLQPTDR
ncbi:MAG TPA: hypothetical protein VEB59_12535 [Gemmatimonadales bacterium]|nr:hypothetical protein [Gemmatimonadales bacterium]